MSEPKPESNLPQEQGKRAAVWLLLLFVVAATLAVVMIPALIIQPFKPQTARGVYLLPGGRRLWLKLPAVMLLLTLTLVAVWFARQNHFEWMFHPLPNAS